MLKAVLFVLVCLCVITVVKSVRPEFSLILRLCAVSGILLTAIAGFDSVMTHISSFIDAGSIDYSYLKLALKITAVGIIAQIAADICRDCGETGLATAVETVSKLFILALSLPLAETLLKMSFELFK